MRVTDCHNFHDFRLLAKKRLPGPIFNYIDGAADDEITNRRNNTAFDSCDLLPGVLRDVSEVDTSVTVMGLKLAMPVYCSPTALQRLFHDRIDVMMDGDVQGGTHVLKALSLGAKAVGIGRYYLFLLAAAGGLALKGHFRS